MLKKKKTTFNNKNVQFFSEIHIMLKQSMTNTDCSLVGVKTLDISLLKAICEIYSRFTSVFTEWHYLSLIYIYTT